MTPNDKGKGETINIEFDQKALVKKSNIGIEIYASLLPRAKIITKEGGYQLKSHLQSSYGIGINYARFLNKNTSFFTGFHLIIGKRNYFVNIPASDFPGNTFTNDLLLENKDIWSSLRIPLLLQKRVGFIEKNTIFFKCGISLRYSGMMNDEDIEGIIIDSSGQKTSVFNASLSGRNKGNPWITFISALSKPFVLDNRNIFILEIYLDVSPTYFFKGEYEITIPGKPVSRGDYKISGTSLGLSVQYIFTGTNKQFIRKYRENAL